MRKYPFVKQRELKDCGICSLQMIIKYYDGYINKNTLIEETKVSKKGITAYHLIETAKKIGFNSIGYKCKLNDLEKLTYPLIVHTVIDKTYNHYIVIYENDVKNKTLLIADPADKIKKISYKNFLSIWSNIVITMVPIKQIKKEKQITFWNFINTLLKTNKKDMIINFLLSTLLIILSILISFYFNLMTNHNKTIHIFCAFSLIVLVKIILEYIKNNLSIKINHKLDLNMTKRIFKKLIFLPYRYYSNHTTGEVLTKILETNKIKDIIISMFLILTLDIIMIIFSSIFLFIISKHLFLITVILFLIYLIVQFLINKKLNNRYQKIVDLKSDTSSHMIESISFFESIKGNNIENKIVEKFDYKYNELLTNTEKYEKLYNWNLILKELTDKLNYLLIILIGVYLYKSDYITIGNLFTYYYLSNFLIEPIKNISDINLKIKEAKNSFKNINYILETEPEQYNLKKIDFKSIEFKNVTFSYDDKVNVLKNINFKINKFEKVMLIGKTGTGKSTILKLIKKYYETNNLYINNVNINDIDTNFLNKNIGYISQKEHLFTDTLYNNISFNNESEQQVKEVCQICLVDEIMEKNNLTMNSLIEENGFNLSGGEIQRIILARTILKQYPIILIDEGLNELDPIIERKILTNLFNKYKNTIVMVSHRYDNKDLFDRIIQI